MKLCRSWGAPMSFVPGVSMLCPLCSYIYEGPGAGTTDLDPAFRALRNHVPAREILTLADYR